MTETFEEFKTRIRTAEKEPLPEGVEIRCICGEHLPRIILTDEEIEDLWRIVNDGKS